MREEITSSPEAKDIDFLTQKINEETLEYDSLSPFGLFKKNDQGNIIAGLNGYIYMSCIYTDQLWVDTKYRKKGVAREMMERMFDYGRTKRCNIATVQTMSIQGGARIL